MNSIPTFPASNSQRRPPRVVVVDDDQAVVSSLKFALGIEGYRVSAFFDARSYLDQSHTDRRVPTENGLATVDCLIVDYRLPGMNGIQLLEELARRGPMPPHLLIASNPSKSCRSWAAHSGVPLVEKPFLDEALTERIRAALWSSAPVLRT